MDFSYSTPTSDSRVESCKIHEESIRVVDQVQSAVKKSNLINPIVVASEVAAQSRNQSLAAIRPTDVNLKIRPRSVSEIEEAKAAFEILARQASMFDKELDTIEPCPYEIKMNFLDGDGKRREKLCGDWETQAAFFKLRQSYGDTGALNHLRDTYCDKYVSSGLVLALGNMASRPQTWQLLGIIPVKPDKQLSLL